MTFATVLAMEVLKLRRAKITWVSWLAFSALPAAGGAFMWIAAEPERAASLGLLGTKASLTGLTADWPSYFTLLLQTTGLGGMLMVSVLASFVFGREYAEGTAKNLLTLPVERHWFVIAKLTVVLGWFALLTLSLVIEGLAVGSLLELPGYSTALALRSVAEIFLAAFVAWTLVPVVAWIATAGRGYFAPLGFTIAMLVLGNVLGATGWGRWFPWSIVPLFAGVAGPRGETLGAESAAVLAFTFALGLAATIHRLRTADTTQ
jgi:ABC-type transport system involved in multi-copper enzyme maturation permease subunit